MKNDEEFVGYSLDIKKVLYKDLVADVIGYVGDRILLKVEGKSIATKVENVKLIEDGKFGID